MTVNKKKSFKLKVFFIFYNNYSGSIVFINLGNNI